MTSPPRLPIEAILAPAAGAALGLLLGPDLLPRSWGGGLSALLAAVAGGLLGFAVIPVVRRLRPQKAARRGKAVRRGRARRR